MLFRRLVEFFVTTVAIENPSLFLLFFHCSSIIDLTYYLAFRLLLKLYSPAIELVLSTRGYATSQTKRFPSLDTDLIWGKSTKQHPQRKAEE